MSDQVDSWYEELRSRYRPDHVKLLLVGESAPDSRGAERRFFYAPALTGHDNLFRATLLALYDYRFPPRSTGVSKVPWLERMRDDGVLLIDLVPYPINGLSSAERRTARRDHVDEFVATCAALNPWGVIICHGPTFEEAAQPLRSSGVRLLHRQPIPFPLGNWQAQFVSSVRSALSDSGWEPLY